MIWITQKYSKFYFTTWYLLDTNYLLLLLLLLLLSIILVTNYLFLKSSIQILFIIWNFIWAQKAKRSLNYTLLATIFLNLKSFMSIKSPSITIGTNFDVNIFIICHLYIYFSRLNQIFKLTFSFIFTYIPKINSITIFFKRKNFYRNSFKPHNFLWQIMVSITYTWLKTKLLY